MSEAVRFRRGFIAATQAKEGDCAVGADILNRFISRESACELAGSIGIRPKTVGQRNLAARSRDARTPSARHLTVRDEGIHR